MQQLERISELMMQQDKIRNIALIAHIDHGKTTLSDSLLAAAGILAPSIAGEARALDYLPEEQRRGITMKTANISLLLKKDEEDFLINLIDSPGHVDFSGKVARALRVVDGAIVVIDAVEQIMAQTETVVRQCITEAVKPILFINKIDRLITELKLSPKEIAERIEIIYNNFNALLAKYSSNASIPKWRCTTRDGSVVFGSALHRWALSVPLAKRKRITFDEIVQLYNTNNIERLQELLPIADPLIEMIVDHLPDPKTAQKYRIGTIWKGDLSSDVGVAMANCSVEENSPLVFCSTKILVDSHAGPLVLGRIFAGRLIEKAPLYFLSTNETKKIQHIFIYMGSEKKRLNNVPAGNTVAISGLGQVYPGETIIGSKITEMLPFEEIRYLANPVVTIALEPKMLRDLSQLKRVLERHELEDPNLIVKVDDQSGEILLMGLGELHLETTIKDISLEVECTSSEPLVIIIEKIATSSGLLTQESFGTKVTVSIESIFDTTDTTQSSCDKIEKLSQYRNEIIIKENVLSKISTDTLNNILLGIKNALRTGPVSSKPVSEVKVKVHDFQVEGREKFEHTVPLLRNTVWSALKLGKIITQEPIYRIQITTPTSYLGKLTSVLNKRRGSIQDIRTDQDFLIITGHLPVVESFGIDQDLRAESEGRAFWQMSFERYEPIPNAHLEELK